MVSAGAIGERTVRKVSRRLLPFLYVVAFLDRVNFGYAALDMNSALGIPAEASDPPGIFFIGYLLFEVPANMILQRIGARARISRYHPRLGNCRHHHCCCNQCLRTLCPPFRLPRCCRGGVLPGDHPVHHLLVPAGGPRPGRGTFHDRPCRVHHHRRTGFDPEFLDNIHWFGIAGWRWLLCSKGCLRWCSGSSPGSGSRGCRKKPH